MVLKLSETSVCCRVQQLGKVWSQSEHSKYISRAENTVFFNPKITVLEGKSQNPDWTQKHGPANHEHVSHQMGPEMLNILGTSYAPAFFIIGRRVFILGQVNLEDIRSGENSAVFSTFLVPPHCSDTTKFRYIRGILPNRVGLWESSEINRSHRVWFFHICGICWNIFVKELWELEITRFETRNLARKCVTFSALRIIHVFHVFLLHQTYGTRKHSLRQICFLRCSQSPTFSSFAQMSMLRYYATTILRM